MLAEFLQPYKANEQAEAGILLMDDPEAKRIVAYWPNYPLAWSRPKGNPPEDSVALWSWLWLGVPINLQLIAVQAGVPANIAESKLEVLEANRLIYPDRTISSWAQKILRAEVVRRYTGGPK